MHTCIHIRQKRIFEADKLKPGARNTNHTEQERRSEISNKKQKQKQKKSKITWITESVKVLHIWKIQKETKPWDNSDTQIEILERERESTVSQSTKYACSTTAIILEDLFYCARTRRDWSHFHEKRRRDF